MILFCAVTHTWGQTPVALATWTFTNASGDWGPNVKDPASSASNITVGGLTRGAGITTTGTAAGSAWGGTGFNDGIAAGSQTAATAISNENYITFTLKANAGYNISLSEIAPYNIRRSNTGPASMLWQYSLDGNSFTDIGTTITGSGNTNSIGNDKPAIPLNEIPALQNVPSSTTITVRLVLWTASGDGGTWYLNGASSNPQLIINGIVNSTPLPLQLISFSGKQAAHANQLEWVTASEKNVAHFELERATDGKTFTRLTTVKARGNTEGASSYAYSDPQAGATAYYRLKIVDEDGSLNYSGIVVLRNRSNAGLLGAFPNPAGQTLYLEGMKEGAAYHITDAAGREVLSGNNVQATGTALPIDIQRLLPGIYFVRTSDGQSLRFVKK